MCNMHKIESVVYIYWLFGILLMVCQNWKELNYFIFKVWILQINISKKMPLKTALNCKTVFGPTTLKNVLNFYF